MKPYNNRALKKYKQNTGAKVDIWIVMQIYDGRGRGNKCLIFSSTAGEASEFVCRSYSLVAIEGSRGIGRSVWHALPHFRLLITLKLIKLCLVRSVLIVRVRRYTAVFNESSHTAVFLVSVYMIGS